MKEYLESKDKVLKELSSNEESGLSAGEASSRLAQYGPNELEKEEKTPGSASSSRWQTRWSSCSSLRPSSPPSPA